MFFLILLAFLQVAPQPANANAEAMFLGRSDLPNDFRFSFLDLGFAALRVRLDNQSEQAWSYEASKIRVLDPKGKELERAASTDITPAVVRSRTYRPTLGGTHGEIGSDQPPLLNPRYAPRVGLTPKGAGGPATISVRDTQEIRETLERHQLQDGILQPGETVEGLIYFKSKKNPKELSGSKIILSNGTVIEIP